jgi:hypothetical protein
MIETFEAGATSYTVHLNLHTAQGKPKATNTVHLRLSQQADLENGLQQNVRIVITEVEERQRHWASDKCFQIIGMLLD